MRWYTCLGWMVGATTVALAAVPIRAGGLELELISREKLPNFRIDGREAKIHTQGLFATQRHYYVTGRLERPPKRPLLLRFRRDDLSRVEFLDLTPAGDAQPAAGSLDHPGGFDFDGESFWIPVAVSRPRSPTAVVRVRHRPDHPLDETLAETVFRVDDHIGAIAFDRKQKLIIAANWDTKAVLLLRTDGSLVERIPREQLLTDNPAWALAVQDWKSLGNGRVLAGGIDKSPDRDRGSRAMIEILDIPNRRRIVRLRLNPPDESMGWLTREGLARWGDEVLFLPGDLGSNAEIFHYRASGLQD